MNELSDYDKKVIADLELILAAKKSGKTVQEQDTNDAGIWKPRVGDAYFPWCQYRVKPEPIDGELAERVREYIRHHLAGLITIENVSQELRDIAEGLGVLKGGESCE